MVEIGSIFNSYFNMVMINIFFQIWTTVNYIHMYIIVQKNTFIFKYIFVIHRIKKIIGYSI